MEDRFKSDFNFSLGKMIEGSSLVRPFLQTGENLESLSCIFGLLYVHSFRFKVVQRLGVSVAAPPRHFPRSITKISSFCASLRPCCVFSFRRPRCFLISFKSCRAANSASSACFPLALARPPLPLAGPPTSAGGSPVQPELYNRSIRLTSARSGSGCATAQGCQNRRKNSYCVSNGIPIQWKWTVVSLDLITNEVRVLLKQITHGQSIPKVN